MAKQIILTSVAGEDYEIVLDYLFNKYGTAVIISFIEQFEEV